MKKRIALFLLVACFGAHVRAGTPAAQPKRWTPELTMQVKEITSVVPSPDGKRVAFGVREAVMDGDKSEYRTQIRIAHSDGSHGFHLTRGEKPQKIRNGRPTAKSLPSGPTALGRERASRTQPGWA